MKIETECEADGRWIAEITLIPGVMAYGDTQQEAVAHVEALALRVLADRLEQGESVAQYSLWSHECMGSSKGTNSPTGVNLYRLDHQT